MQKRSPTVNASPLHIRNKHRHGYDFAQLIKAVPDFSPFVKRNQYGNLSIDFADPDAVRMLNKALLLTYYQLSYWDIPNDYLCPPIPGRADYMHYLADLLAEDNQHIMMTGKKVQVLDIGMGANMIYPIIGRAEYGWSFVGSDINPTAIKVASLITKANSLLKGSVQCRLQKNRSAIFDGIIQPKEFYMLTLCNPPFHASAQAALASTQKKLKNLGKLGDSKQKTVLNFGGQHMELWCQGGESTFISNMIKESANYKTQCLWFTTLVSKKESLPVIRKHLEAVEAIETKIVPMAQGQKISRFVAWTYFNKAERQQFLANY
ncbi:MULTISPECIES: 23S rRNA (adenine(1618)-N(6))-methyltransferase RlmF [unclassified Gilliamella]|uniref:23S rRNA (adenine(1618)-N(6))-methyltransferase RlmF n=1 Tax=unclassified Gilliamella TaxID=2685620 RepID=UPI001C6A7E5A|nr:23S rRNA (adenine(1618)-N(6))-methyltransferase RlmF [Gilliamella sp. ESL0441]QYN43971.1 23S rRNA (adenine(1618)-N(6))-methyltransferase RlmF [Gilliamella sp. ESL0441]